MLFSSTVFLFLFLPIAILAYYLVGKALRNYILLLASLIFYAWGGVSYSVILLFSILVNYSFGILIAKHEKPRLMLGIGVGINIVLLVFFKYTNFFVENIEYAIDKQLNITYIVLPIGISFFTFQSISYLVDIYRKEGGYQKNIANLALYISLFPQLIAGPIVRYHDVASQIIKRRHSLELFGQGVERFIIGLAKKVLLANNFAMVADQVMGSDLANLSTPAAWIGIVAYSFQIYFDFSGYSDMAIGLGKMFGFTFLENFNFPYVSKSVKEFWRRWHISLSTWFRDYLYIPLGGNRVSNFRIYVNLLIVFALTGFWHGASWSFMVWGLYHGFFLVIERLGLGKILEKLWSPIGHFYTILVVIVGWVFFRVESLSDAIQYVKTMFVSNFDDSIWYTYLDRKFIIVSIIGIISATRFFPFIKSLFESYLGNVTVISFSARMIYLISLLSLFSLSAIYLVSDVYNPFIYFRF